MAAVTCVGVTATKAPWGPAFRAFVRDHASGVNVTTIMSGTQLPEPGQRPLDVLIVDDQMPLLTAAHIAAAKDLGTHVIGLWDETVGRGRDHVIDLGVNEPLPASTSPADLLHAIQRIGPRNAGTGFAGDTARIPTGRAAGIATRSPNGAKPPQRARRAIVSAFTAVSGGGGQTEAVAAAANRLAGDTKVLVIEASAATLASRLRRSPDYGLAWCLERAASGHRVIPEGLSPAREDGARPLGHFDAICGTTSPEGPPTVNAAQLGQLLDQAATDYDHIIVETGPLSAPPAVPGGDRFAVARAVLARADQVVVFAAAHPGGAIKLTEWRSALRRHELDADLHTVAVFGRAPTRRFERAELLDTLDRNTGESAFESVYFLPEDKRVRRARWDGELATKGPWARAVADLAADLSAAAQPTKAAPAGKRQRTATRKPRRNEQPAREPSRGRR